MQKFTLPSITRRAALLAGVGAVLLPASMAIAQAEPASVPVASAGEVLVTARRVSESLDRVPVAITAFGSEQLAERMIISETDLQRSIPGLTVRTGQTSNFLSFSIRGQSLDQFTGSSPAVLPYFNDVQLTTYSASSFYDLDSIQVLKGPQGTLFGRNATGGAVLYSSAKPTDELEGFVTGRVGNFDMWELQGAINIPVVEDKVLLRVAGNIQRRDGFQENIYRDEHHGQIKRESGRASLTLRPTDGIENTTVFQYSHAGGDNLQLAMWSANACGSTNNGIPLASTAACLYGPALDNLFGAGAWEQYMALHPGAQPGGIMDQVAFQKELGPWKVNTWNPSIHKARDWFVTNTTNVELAPDLELKNIFGIAKSRSHDMYDAQGTGPYFLQGQDSSIDFNYGGTYTGVTNSTFQWSNESQLIGQAFDGTMDFIVGFYASYQRNKFFAPVSFIELRPFIDKAVQINDTKIIDKTQAIYAQVTQDLGGLTGVDGLKLTGGFRYTWEQLNITQGPLATAQQLATLPVNPADLYEKASFSDPSWTVGLEYQASSDLLLYVAQRGSWRSGGFNGNGPARFGTAAVGGNLFDSETTYDVELGAKYNGWVGAVPFRFNIALYNQWVKDIQRVTYTTPPAEFAVGGQPSLSAITVNIPKARVRGIEVDTSITPAQWLQIGGTLAYTNAKYTNGTTVVFGEPITYGPYGDTPKWSGTAFAAVTLPTPEQWGEVVLRGDIYAQTGQYFSNLAGTVAPDTKLPGYALANLRLDWNNINGSPVSVAAFAKNITKEKYYSGGMALIAFGQNGVIPGEPRTYGLEATIRF